MNEPESPDSFDRDYVQGIRNEAAKYRTELKETRQELEGYKGLEAQIQTIRIENEFIRRGITAEPQWVQVQEGVSPSQAVDSFLEKYPQFAVGGSQEEAPKVELKAGPQAMPPKKTNLNDSLSTRSLDEIKNDPVARSNLTDLYRELIKTESNQTD